MDSGTTEDLNDIWGSAADDIYSVGNAGTVLHFDGVSWENISPLGFPQDLYSVHGGWIVGEDGLLLTIADGEIWGFAFPSDRRLNGVWGVGDEAIFVRDGGDIFHWRDPGPRVDGPALTVNDLLSVSGSSMDNIFAIGDTGVIFHFDGAEWTSMSSGFRIRDDSPDERWDITDAWSSPSGEIFVSSYLGPLLHYNGVFWESIGLFGGTTFEGVSGCRPEDVYYVGSRGVILHYDGNQLTFMEAPTTAHLNDVWCASEGEVYAVGNDDLLGISLVYDGLSWENIDSSESGGFISVFRLQTGEFITVGFEGTIGFYHDGDWLIYPPLSEDTLYDVWGSSSEDIYATGGHTLVHFDGDDWIRIESPIPGNIKAGCGSNMENTFYLISRPENTTIWRYNDVGWRFINMPKNFIPYAILESDSMGLLLVGNGGRIAKLCNTSDFF